MICEPEVNMDLLIGSQRLCVKTRQKFDARNISVLL